MEKYYKKYEWYYLIPIIFILTVVPLIVYLKVIPLLGVRYEFWKGEKTNFDFFSYYKVVWFLIATAMSLLMLGIKSYQNDFNYIRKSVYYYPIVCYIIFVVLSTLFSKYKDIAMYGYTDRYEGMFTLIAYILLLFVTINLIREEKDVKVLLGAIITGGIIVGIIGALQYFGIDIWKSSFGKSLMLPSKYIKDADKLNFLFAKHTIYATLYHTDYVGSYMAMLFPLTFTLFLLCKNKVFKVFMAVVTVLMGINWLGCNSRAGMVGVVVAMIILVIMINKYIVKNWKFFVVGIGAIIIVFVGLNTISKGYLSKRFSTLITDAKKIVQNDNTDKNTADKLPLKDIKVNGKEAQIITSTEKLNVKLLSNGQIEFFDSNNTLLQVNYDKSKGKITFKDDRYKAYDLTLGKMNNKSTLVVKKDNITLYFQLTNDKITLIDNKGFAMEWGTIKSIGFEGKETLGSARGYIWSRSLPLLKNAIICGYGPDTFAIHFPQNDLKGKMLAYGDMWMFVDKPHNIYLQSAINTGMISLIALLTLFIMYFIKSVKIYFKCDFDDFTKISGVAIFVSICGYLVAGFFNDSIVSVAPVFWVLLGLGISINQMNMPEKIKS